MPANTYGLFALMLLPMLALCSAPAAASAAPERCTPADIATLLKKGDGTAVDAWLACRQRCSGDGDCVSGRGVCGDEAFYNEVYKVEVEAYLTLRRQSTDCAAAPRRVLSRAVCAAGRCGAKPDLCAAAHAELAALLRSLPRDCAKDADCEGAYIQADACAPAVIFRKDALKDAKLRAHLETLQGTVRNACVNGGPVCSPQPYRALCRNAVCENTRP